MIDVQALVGVPGPAGPAGPAFRIIGSVASVSALPEPTGIADGSLYIVTGQNNALYGVDTSSNTWKPIGVTFSQDVIISLSQGGTGQNNTSGIVANTVFMGPSSGTGGASFRKLVAADLPTATVAKGGTGRATLTTNAVLIGKGTSAVGMIASASGAFYSTGSGSVPAFGTLPVAQGGTGRATLTSNNVLIGKGTSAIGMVAATPGVFKCASNGAAPAFSKLTVADLPLSAANTMAALYSNGSAALYGTLPVAAGGTGLTTVPYNGIIVAKNNDIAALSITGNGAVYSQSGSLVTSGALPLNCGGTGQTSITEVSTVANIATAASNYEVTSAYYITWGKVAQVFLTIKSTNSIAAGGTATCCTMVTGKRPKRNCALGYNNRTGIINTSGAVSVTHDVSVAAGGSFSISAIYLLP